MRLDQALADRELVRSRSHAKALIIAGGVFVNGSPITRPAFVVKDTDAIEVVDPSARLVSRAGLKLIGALDSCAPFGLTVNVRRALDIGASTGGFTQVLLERGADHVVALDVGHDQIAPILRDDDRVSVVEGVNARTIDETPWARGVDLVVADASFISLTYIVPPLARAVAPGTDVLLMVKPQFEVGRDILGSGGVVTNPKHRAAAVRSVAASMIDHGWTIHLVRRSELPGPHGNVEYFVWASSAWEASGSTRPNLFGERLDRAIEEEVHAS